MTDTDSIIADLLKKIDNLQETINMQNAFIMRMATYRDEREDRWEEARLQRWREIKDAASSTGILEIIYRWIEAERRPPYTAGQPESESSTPEDLDS